MATDELLEETRTRMDKSIKVLEEELTKLRGGRANPAILEDIKVDYYGTPTPLKHIAHLSAPEADLLVVRPYDPTQRQAIEKAILEANLGLNPAVDEEVLRIKVPKLSEERRRELVKLVHERGEEAKIALRNIRRDTKETLEKLKREGQLPEDDFHRRLQALDETIHEYNEKVDQAVAQKEHQLQTV